MQDADPEKRNKRRNNARIYETWQHKGVLQLSRK